MQKSIQYLLAVTLLSIPIGNSSAQSNSVVLQAMQDELNRNMRELILEGYDKPFFISYGLRDEKTFFAAASLGALKRSSENTARFKSSARLLVGDYDFNDESFDNNVFNPSQSNEIDLPLDDDYLGIRRSLWVTTDNLYRGASRKFKKNQETLKEQNKPLSELPHRSFAKTAPSHIDIAGTEFQISKKELEDYVRELSTVFTGYPDVYSSMVTLNFSQGYKYLANSEGTVNRIPFNLGVLQISAQVRTKEGEMFSDQRSRYFRIPAQLPAVEEMKKEAIRMAEALIHYAEIPLLKDDYNGPVLFMDEAVSFLLNNLFRGENLMATNAVPALTGFHPDESNASDSKIGKQIFSEGVTVKALPGLKAYNNVDLLGSFEADDEGVVPEKEIVLVENGVLKNVMNDRTLTKANQPANGLGNGPGVLQVTFRGGQTPAELKSRLITLAKQEGLEYAMIVKDASSGGIGLFNVYKVSVTDGKEELIRGAQIKPVTTKNFKKIAGAGKALNVYHPAMGIRQSLTSFIVPQAVLLHDVEISESRRNLFTEEEYVSSPLKKTDK